MSENSEIAARLTALPDGELVAVLQIVTAGRPAFWAVRAALDELAGVRHAEPVGDVSPDTAAPSVPEAARGGGVSGQVGTGFSVPTAPVRPSGIPAPSGGGGYSPSGIPTFESVRDKVEQRFGTAEGMGELDRQTSAGRSADEQFAAREKAARERLEQVRKSLHGNDVDSP